MIRRHQVKFQNPQNSKNEEKTRESTYINTVGVFVDTNEDNKSGNFTEEEKQSSTFPEVVVLPLLLPNYLAFF